MNTDVRYEEARARVMQLKGFYIHLTVYVLVNLGLFAIDFATSRDAWWFYWPLLGWGIGIAAHAASVFVSGGVFGRDWEERKIKELMRRGGS